jgi:hypothetical protein
MCTAAALVSTQDMGTMRAAKGAFPWFGRCDVHEQRKRGRCPQGSWYQTGNIYGGEARRCSVRGRCEGSSTWLTTDQRGMQVEKRMRQTSRAGHPLSKLSVTICLPLPNPQNAPSHCTELHPKLTPCFMSWWVYGAWALLCKCISVPRANGPLRISMTVLRTGRSRPPLSESPQP